jgi:TolB-like protein
VIALGAVLAATTIAVMPFKDLSGGKGQVGEAIRETVTSDLKDAGLQVVERGNIDKVIAEQNLQAKKNDLGMAESIRVGTLLGATMIVAGAYQRASSQVRLTARFVDVATGEIKGSAKVDGATADLLTLQDKISVELCKSAGLGRDKAQLFTKRTRPKVKSMRAVELYGDAVTQTDDTKKVELLKLSLNEDPQFSYASRDLDALEKRMKGYAAAADAAQRQATIELQDKLRKEKDPNMIAGYYGQLFGQLLSQRRYHRMIAISRALVANPPPQTNNWYSLVEQAQYYIVYCYSQLKEDDALLSEGEKFLAKYPASQSIGLVQMLMNNAINHKHAVADGKKAAEKLLAALPAGERSDPCKRAPILKDNQQLEAAKREWLACDARGGPAGWPPGNMSMILASLALDTRDAPLMKKALARLQREDPQTYRTIAFWEKEVAGDD